MIDKAKASEASRKYHNYVMRGNVILKQ